MSKLRRLLAIAIAIAATPAWLSAQAGTIRGRVVEARTAQPIPVAQVTVVGTGRTVQTNQNGEYTLANVPAGSVVLRASRVGYSSADATVNVVAGETVTESFALSQQITGLDAIVVTGTPGSRATQKRELGNAVATLPVADVIDRMPAITNVSAILQSRVPGLQVVPSSGTEGTNARIRIRGVGSVSAGTSPIYFVDGMRIAGGNLGGFDVGGQSLSALDAIHPEDIASIEVIKGPAAATLYGAEAGNGVIQIITRKGTPGQQGVDYSAEVKYGEQEWGARTLTSYTLCTPARIAAPATWPGCQGVAPNTLLSMDPLRDDPRVLRTGEVRSYHLSARGGGERFGFYLSGNTDDNTGIFFNNTFERWAGRGNFTVTPSDQFDAQLNFGYVRTDTRLPLGDNASNGITGSAFRMIPGRVGLFETNWPNLNPDVINGYNNTTRVDRFLTSATVRYQPFDWFSNRLSAGFDHMTRKAQTLYLIDRTGRQPWGATNARGAKNQYRPVSRLYTLDYAGTLSNDLPREFTSEFSFGSQLVVNQFEALQGNADTFASDKLNLISAAANRLAFEQRSENASVGYFVQEKIGWRNRLFLTGALRADDNSTFGEEFDIVWYPKASLSYVISEEGFFNVPGVDQLRLRAAWGQAGNSPDPFLADQVYGADVAISALGTAIPTLTPSSFGNPNLHAEKGQEIEAGFEASLLGGRVGVDLTYFNQNKQDALFPIPVPPSSGFPGTQLRNVGEISNSGVELAIDALVVESDAFQWQSRINASTLRNRLEEFGADIRPYTVGFLVEAFGLGQRVIEGGPIPQFWAIAPLRDPATGALVRNSAGAVLPNLADTVVYGGNLPTRTLSWDNSFDFFNRSLRFSTQFDYQGGHYQMNLTKLLRAKFDQTVREVADPTFNPEERDILLANGIGTPYVEKADFVKLREVALAYSLPQSFTNRFGSDRMTFSISGRNLKTWTDYTGTDPEVNADGNPGGLALNDNAGTPPTRRWVASISVTF